MLFLHRRTIFCMSIFGFVCGFVFGFFSIFTAFVFVYLHAQFENCSDPGWVINAYVCKCQRNIQIQVQECFYITREVPLWSVNCQSSSLKHKVTNLEQQNHEWSLNVLCCICQLRTFSSWLYWYVVMIPVALCWLYFCGTELYKTWDKWDYICCNYVSFHKISPTYSSVL